MFHHLSITVPIYLLQKHGMHRHHKFHWLHGVADRSFPCKGQDCHSQDCFIYYLIIHDYILAWTTESPVTDESTTPVVIDVIEIITTTLTTLLDTTETPVCKYKCYRCDRNHYYYTNYTMYTTRHN